MPTVHSTLLFASKMFSVYVLGLCQFLSILQLGATAAVPLSVDSTLNLFNPSHRNDTPTIPIGNPADGFVVDRAVYWGAKLRSTAVLFNAVNALTVFARLGFNDDIGDTVLTLPSQPRTAIVVLPKDIGGTMERRFAIWGIYLGVYHMIHSQRFECSTFYFSWKGVPVGNVVFAGGTVAERRSSLAAGDLASKGLFPVRNASAIEAVAFRNDTSVSAEPVLSVIVQLFGKVIPINDIFLTVLGALSDLARFPEKDAPALSFIYNDSPVPVYMSFYGRALDPRFTGRIEVKHIIETVGYLPEVMFQQRQFREANVLMKLDDVEVGVGQLVRAERRGVGLANLTTS